MEKRGELRTMPLPVKLTEEELRARSKRLSAEVKECEREEQVLEDTIEAAKEARKAQENKIAALRAVLRATAEVVQSGRETRDVEVRDEMDWKASTVLTRRTDTDELVASRGMSEAERQRCLFTTAADAGLEAIRAHEAQG